MPKSLSDIQGEVLYWTEHNFPGGSSNDPLIGMMEELGELSHAHLKKNQGVRTGEDHQAAKVDALGDILIYMLDYCNKCNIDLEDALNKTWEEVRKRDWIANPVTGKV